MNYRIPLFTEYYTQKAQFIRTGNSKQKRNVVFRSKFALWMTSPHADYVVYATWVVQSVFTSL